MTINYNVTGAERKRLADYISGFMGTEKKYLGAPTFAYQIGYLTVSKDGAVSFEDRGYNSDINALMAELEGQGFHTEDTIAKADTAEQEATSGENAAQPNEASTEPEATPAEDGIIQPHGYGLTVTLPAASLPPEALVNLTSLLTAKGRLIRKALGVEALPVEVKGGAGDGRCRVLPPGTPGRRMPRRAGAAGVRPINLQHDHGAGTLYRRVPHRGQVYAGHPDRRERKPGPTGADRGINYTISAPNPCVLYESN